MLSKRGHRHIDRAAPADRVWLLDIGAAVAAPRRRPLNRVKGNFISFLSNRHAGTLTRFLKTTKAGSCRIALGWIDKRPLPRQNEEFRPSQSAALGKQHFSEPRADWQLEKRPLESVLSLASTEAGCRG